METLKNPNGVYRGRRDRTTRIYTRSYSQILIVVRLQRPYLFAEATKLRHGEIRRGDEAIFFPNKYAQICLLDRPFPGLKTYSTSTIARGMSSTFPSAPPGRV
jgi:hypothetical protein